MTRFRLLLLFLLSALILCACAPQSDAAPTAFVKEGFQITLPASLTERESEAFLLLADTERSVAVYRTPFSDTEGGEFSHEEGLEAFAVRYCEASGIDQALTNENGLLYLTLAPTDDALRHRLYFYQGGDAFWIVDFGVAKELFPAAEKALASEAATVRLP